MQRLIYVSKSKVKAADARAVIAQIIAGSDKRNSYLEVTGALIFSGAHFAQVLEGSQKAINELMISINNDTRHEAISVVDRSSITERQFSRWAMAYQGPSQFVSRHVTRLFDTTPGADQKRATHWLTQLAREFLRP